MSKLCTTKRRAVKLARARARKTGRKMSLWKCGPCYKTTGEAVRAPGRCKWVGWALPAFPRH